MDKQKQQLLILGALSLVLIFFLVTTFMPKKKSPRIAAANTSAGPLLNLPQPASSEAPRVETGAAKATPEELKSQQEKTVMDWGVDPFFHLVDKEVYKGSSLTLKGVSIGKGRRRYATINDEIVTIGDSAFGYRVEEIDKTRVLLKRGDESYYLVFPEE